MKSKANSTGRKSTPKKTEKDDKKTDITDPKRDQERLQGDEATIDLPEVKDISPEIPVDPAVIDDPQALSTTVASADEEGEGVLDDLNKPENDEDTIVMGTEADVSQDELEVLDKTDYFYPSKDEETLERGSMVSTDDDGEPLNEQSFGNNIAGGDRSGKDLDIPGSEDDDREESIGAEDEENNAYSLGGDKEDFNESDKS